MAPIYFKTYAMRRVQRSAMCGRFARYQPLPVFAEAAGVPAPQAEGRDGPRYNIAPGTPAWLLARDARGEVVFTELPWRFPTSRGNRINVRSETAQVVPEYREPFAQHRCLVLASGFYEPEGPKTEKHRPWWYFEAQYRSPSRHRSVRGRLVRKGIFKLLA